MKTLLYHTKAIQFTIEQLSKGKYILFFTPGIVITLIFWWIRESLGINDVQGTDIHDTWESIKYNLLQVTDSILLQINIFFILTILAPVNTILGERWDEFLTGNKYHFDLIRLIEDMIRMIFVVALAIFLEIIFYGIYYLISWIFGLDFLDDFADWLIASFFFAFSFYDYALERYKIGVIDSLKFAFKNPLAMIISGSIFLIIYKIPMIGIPLSPIFTLMITTVVYLYITKRLPNKRFK